MEGAEVLVAEVLVAVALVIGVTVSAQSHAIAPSGEITLTATPADAGTPLTLRILRWSSDEERKPIVDALAVRTTAPTAGRAAGDSPARGASPATAAAADGAAGAGERAARGAAAGRGGRGRGARGARGETVALTPMAALAAALGKAPTLGYVWTSEITGYAIKYAYRRELPDGSQRIVLATNRRLGASAFGTEPTRSTANDEEFTVIEIHLDGKGAGEGKTSSATTVVLDQEAKTVALDNYPSTPTGLRQVRMKVGDPGSGAGRF